MKNNLKKSSVRLASLGLVTAIALSGGLQVRANENPTQNTVAQNQDSAGLYAGGYKKITASEALADKDVKAAIDRVYAQFPETKPYEINAYEDVVSKGEYDKYVIRLEKDSENFFHFAVDAKTGKVSYTIQSLTAAEVLSYAKSGIDKIYTLYPETKSYEITSANVIDNYVSNFSRYNITFSQKDSKRSITFGINAKTGEIITPKKKEV
ncbi:PepSY domain-containing protein [Brevibacillus halotolerans]|nr:PepSY domain-containing protein [Brevibacillus halotolerans]